MWCACSVWSGLQDDLPLDVYYLRVEISSLTGVGVFFAVEDGRLTGATTGDHVTRFRVIFVSTPKYVFALRR